MKKARRINWLLGTVLIVAASNDAQAEDLNLTVFVQGVGPADLMTVAGAKATTTKIFAGIGVRLHWVSGAPRKTDGAAIAMQFDSSAPARFRPDALAYATPFDESRTCIHIFYDRVLGSVHRNLAAGLLGHVMAHEITHVLERMDRHADMGVMKAHWTSNDYEAMAVRPLPFAAENVEAIHEYFTGVAVAAR